MTGYEQAIANYVYCVEQLITEIDSGDGSVFNKLSSIPLFCDQTQQLDKILCVIADTYNRSFQEVENDVDLFFDNLDQTK